MTNVILTHKGTEYSIEAKEHTDARVCAGISAILFTIAGYITNQPSIIVKKVHLGEGDTAISWSGGCFAKAAYEMAQVGFLQLEAGYPEHIKVNI